MISGHTNVFPCWLLPNNLASGNLEDTFLIDFTTARKKGEGIYERLFFPTTFSHPKRAFIHLRTMEEVTFRILLDDISYNH